MDHLPATSSSVDLKSASAAVLAELIPDLGLFEAEDIVAWRDQHGALPNEQVLVASVGLPKDVAADVARRFAEASSSASSASSATSDAPAAPEGQRVFYDFSEDDSPPAPKQSEAKKPVFYDFSEDDSPPPAKANEAKQPVFYDFSQDDPPPPADKGNDAPKPVFYDFSQDDPPPPADKEDEAKTAVFSSDRPAASSAPKAVVREAKAAEAQPEPAAAPPEPAKPSAPAPSGTVRAPIATSAPRKLPADFQAVPASRKAPPADDSFGDEAATTIDLTHSSELPRILYASLRASTFPKRGKSARPGSWDESSDAASPSTAPGRSSEAPHSAPEPLATAADQVPGPEATLAEEPLAAPYVANSVPVPSSVPPSKPAVTTAAAATAVAPRRRLPRAAIVAALVASNVASIAGVVMIRSEERGVIAPIAAMSADVKGLQAGQSETRSQIDETRARLDETRARLEKQASALDAINDKVSESERRQQAAEREAKERDAQRGRELAALNTRLNRTEKRAYDTFTMKEALALIDAVQGHGPSDDEASAGEAAKAEKPSSATHGTK